MSDWARFMDQVAFDALCGVYTSAPASHTHTSSVAELPSHANIILAGPLGSAPHGVVHTRPMPGPASSVRATIAAHEKAIHDALTKLVEDQAKAEAKGAPVMAAINATHAQRPSDGRAPSTTSARSR